MDGARSKPKGKESKEGPSVDGTEAREPHPGRLKTQVLDRGAHTPAVLSRLVTVAEACRGAGRLSCWRDGDDGSDVRR